MELSSFLRDCLATVMGPIYQKVPTVERPLSPFEEPKGNYLSSDREVEEQANARVTIDRESTKKRLKLIHFIFIGLFAVFYMAFFMTRSYFNPHAVSAGTRMKCHDMMHCIGLAGHIHYKGISVYRNMSLAAAADGKLPTYFTLPSGDKIPSVALGVWRAGKGEVGEAVKTALKTGYRHIDGAWIYGNEAEVGQAIRESGVPRKDIWLTSKLWNTFHEPKDVEPALDESLARLGTDYLDLYLIHWPVAFKNNGKKNDVDFDLTEDTYRTWQKLEEMVEKGKVRNIGLSNFNIRRIQNLASHPLKTKPAVNQVELSYWLPQPELVQWAKDNDLLLEAYSPLGSEEKVKESLDIPEIKKIAKELGITPAQVYISWHVQRGTVVLPKSVHPSRVEENFQVTVLPDDAFQRVEKVATSHKPFRNGNPNWGVDIWN